MPAAAQEVQDCDDWAAGAQFLAEPWEENTRTFANGAVRVALIDTGEPAAGGYRILVLSPPYSQLGDRQCRMVGSGGMGFAGVDFAALAARYDPTVGLILTLPATRFNGGTGDFEDGILRFTLNQATGAIGAMLLQPE
nr:hypothetical protein [Thetidibacter halocola]